MAPLVTRLPLLLWNWYGAHKAVAAVLAAAALVSALLGLDTFLAEPPTGRPPRDPLSRLPAADEQDSEQTQKWLKERIDTSPLMPEAVSGHVQALRDPDPAVRRRAARALWRIGVAAQQALPALLAAVHDPAPEVREQAVQALGRTSRSSPDAVRALVAAVQDPQAGVRAAAAATLAEIWRLERGPQLSAGPGQERGTSPGPAASGARRSSQAAARARAALPVLTQALRDPEARIRAGAAAALGELGADAWPAVEGLIPLVQSDADPAARLWATVALGSIGPEARAAVPVLAERLRQEKDFGLRLNTADALGRIQAAPEVAVPALVKAYLTRESGLGSESAFSALLQQFGPAAARCGIPLLEKALKDPANQHNKALQERAARALERLKREPPGAQTPAAAKALPGS